MYDKLGAAGIMDALTDEILVVAYDYNSQEPRFYSKYYAEIDPNIYNVNLDIATGASSAAPTYFKPKDRVNGYQMQEFQIDGGVICNNPALYSYYMAKALKKKPNVRLLTLGTGLKPFTVKKTSMDKSVYLLARDEFMINIDSFSADYYLHNQFKYIDNYPEGFFRSNIESKFGLDSARIKDLDGMEAQGTEMWNKDKEHIMAIVKPIVDEKVGGKKSQK